VDDSAKAELQLDMNVAGYDAGDSGFAGIDANVLRMNESAWSGIVIGDRIYRWNIVSEDQQNKLELCYELTGSAETCLPPKENNTVKDISVPFYDVSTGDSEGTYQYYLMYNGTGNDNIYIFWSNNTSATAYPPGTIRMKGLGTLDVNTSMYGSTSANSTCVYTDAVGDVGINKYDPDDTDTGFESQAGSSTWLSGSSAGIDTNKDDVEAVDKLDYHAGLGTKYAATSGGSILTITTYKDPVKVQYWIGGTRTSTTTEGGTTTATFTGTGTKSGITVSDFTLNTVDCTSYCSASFEGGEGTVDYTKVVPYLPGVSTLVVLDTQSTSAPVLIAIGGQLVNSVSAGAGVSLSSGDEAVVSYSTSGAKPTVVAAGYTASGTTEAVNDLIGILDGLVS
jgi:hypothetical protein